METITPDQRDNLIATFKRSAIHLEMRDVYATDIERGRFGQWLAGESPSPKDEDDWWRPWRMMMRRNMDSGKSMRRLRIISEPVTDYIRFEWLDTDQLVRAGEEVRWLPRRRASALLLPGNDFWLFDDKTVTFTHFSGDGRVLGHELTTDPEVVGQCIAAFDAAWPVATPHGEYTPS